MINLFYKIYHLKYYDNIFKKSSKNNNKRYLYNK